MNGPSVFRHAWMLSLAACVLTVSLTDALLLELGHTFFTAGFNSIYIVGAGRLGAFALGSLIVDLCLVLGAWSILLPGLRRWKGLP